jgi:hypothetical protein
MQVSHERGAGVDVHKKSVVVTIMVTEATGQMQKQTRTFGTMTADLLDCLLGCKPIRWS